MKYKIKFMLLIFATSTVFFSACNKQDDLILPTETPHDQAVTANTKSETVEYNNDSPVVLGRKLTNPYTVQNMQTAYQNLVAKGEIRAGLEIKTTHKYVRFLPADSTQYDALMSDSTLVLFPYPLDYELEKGGASFQASNQPTSQLLPWLYTAVPDDFRFPSGIQHQVISDLFLPESLNTRENPALIDALDYEALRITDNLGTGTRGSWRPTGTISSYDTIVRGQVLLNGVKVRIYNWFNFDQVYTNSNGYFYSDKQFYGKVQYQIVWETAKYDIRDGYILQAYYNASEKLSSAWNLKIKHGKSLRYATIHRAAYRYHYLETGGLKRPGVWTKLKICYRDEYNSDHSGINWGTNWQYFVFGLAGGTIPNIVLYGKNSTGSYRPTNELFSTTIHELGHASHIELMNAGEIQFLQVSDLLVESWAKAIEWHITKIEYVNLGVTRYDDPTIIPHVDIDNKQDWFATQSETYTPLIIDLIDDYNQLALRGGSRPNDNVFGYTMQNTEQLLKHSYGLSSFSSNLHANRPTNVTQTQLDTYLNFYYSW